MAFEARAQSTGAQKRFARLTLARLALERRLGKRRPLVREVFALRLDVLAHAHLQHARDLRHDRPRVTCPFGHIADPDRHVVAALDLELKLHPIEIRG
jgi:CII-binding regulator of phage lambda lysogenization HflD